MTPTCTLLSTVFITQPSTNKINLINELNNYYGFNTVGFWSLFLPSTDPPWLVIKKVFEKPLILVYFIKT